MARQMKAEREKRANILEAEGFRQGRDPESRGRKAGRDSRGRGSARYIKALSDFANGSNQKVLFLPLEASALLSSISGIGEIAREAMARKDDG